MLVGHAGSYATLRMQRNIFADFSLAPLHRGGDTSRRAIGNRPERIVRKVRVYLRSSCLLVPEHLAYHEERISIRYRKRSEGMA